MNNNLLPEYITRIERLEAEQSSLAQDKKALYDEIKSRGFDAKVVRSIVKDRKQEPEKLAEFESLKDVYKSAL